MRTRINFSGRIQTCQHHMRVKRGRVGKFGTGVKVAAALTVHIARKIGPPNGIR